MSSKWMQPPPHDAEEARKSAAIDKTLARDYYAKLEHSCKGVILSIGSERVSLFSQFTSLPKAKQSRDGNIDKVVFPLGDYILADLQTFECRRRNKASTLLLSGIEPAVLIYVLNPSVESCASIATSCKDALEHFRYVCSTLGNLERCDVTFVLGDCAKMKHVIEDSTAESCKAGQLTLARVFSLEGATNDAASVLTAIVSDFETSAELLRAKAVRTIVVEHAVDANGGARVAKQLCTVLQEVQAERVSQAEQRLEREAKQTTVGSTEGFTTFIVALVPLVALLLYYTFRTKPLTQ